MAGLYHRPKFSIKKYMFKNNRMQVVKLGKKHFPPSPSNSLYKKLVERRKEISKKPI
jgi:hypothetical protein